MSILAVNLACRCLGLPFAVHYGHCQHARPIVPKLEHKWYECAPGCNGCQFCYGGLGHCTVCNGFEGTLPTECPGIPLTELQEWRIYVDGSLDFIDGVWKEKPSKRQSQYDQIVARQRRGDAGL